MISGKTFFVLCMGLLVASQAKNLDAELYDAQLQGIVEEAEKLFKKFQETIEGAINTAVNTLKGFLSEIGSAAAEFEKDLNATLVAAIGPFVKQIENAVAQAAKAGVNVAECTGNSISEITDLPAQLLRNVTSCVANKVNDANDVINGFIDDVQNTIKVVMDIGNKIHDCESGGFIHLALCLGKVTANITIEIAELPVKIAGDVVQAGKYIATIIPSFAACDFGAHTAVVFQAGSIAGNVTSCISDKMSKAGNTTTTPSGNSTDITTASGSSDATTASGASDATTASDSSDATKASDSSDATTAPSDATTAAPSDTSTAAASDDPTTATGTESESTAAPGDESEYELKFLKFDFLK